MENKAVSDTGPITHLAQIGIFEALSLFEMIYIPTKVFDEICIFKSPGSRELKAAQYIKSIRVNEDVLSNVKKRSDIKLHEAEEDAIALCKQLDIQLFLTDDMNARKAGKSFGLRVHGSIGIISRAYREGMIDIVKAKQLLDDLYHKSTLYVAKTIVDEVKEDLEKYGTNCEIG